MKSTFQIIASSLFLMACNTRQTEMPAFDASVSESPVKETYIINTLNEKTVPDGLLILNGVDADDDLEQALHDNLFGKFFADRAEFFVINKPINKIYESSIQSITLFYLDGQLSQTKYIVDTNIAERLVQQFGNFTIVGLDQQNKKIIVDHTVMIEDSNNSQRLNPRLDNFEMTWKKGTSQIKYRVSNVNKMDRYTYIEQLANYEQAYRSVERSIN